MIVINNNEYKNIKKIVSYGDYEVIVKENIRTGVSPIIDFVGENFTLTIETVFDIQWIQNIEIGTKLDVTKDISNIIYNDGTNKKTLVNGNYSCILTKIAPDKLILFFECKEEQEKIFILINETLEFAI